MTAHGETERLWYVTPKSVTSDDQGKAQWLWLGPTGGQVSAESPVPASLLTRWSHSPMVRRRSSHWLMCGNLRISFHFLLLPLRFPPPPAEMGRKKQVICLLWCVGAMSTPLPAQLLSQWEDPVPCLYSGAWHRRAPCSHRSLHVLSGSQCCPWDLP